MAYSFQDFAWDFREAKDLAEVKYPSFPKLGVKVGWETYSNSKANGLGLMLFGRHTASIRTDVAKRLDNAFTTRMNAEDSRLKNTWYVPRFYRRRKIQGLYDAHQARRDNDIKHEMTKIPGIDTDEKGAMRENFGIVNNDRSGAVLLMGSGNWNFTMNDCWLIGAVHSHLPFYPASTLSNANIFDDKYVLSITGRELYGLALFGYRHLMTQHGGQVYSEFQMHDQSKADGARLKRYQEEINNLTTKQMASDMFVRVGFQIAQVGY